MDINRTQSLTDVIHDSIDYSGIEREILGTPIFNRLHRIMQSSLVFLTYPSDKVKRFEHSVGVMHLAGELFFSSVCNANPEVLSALLDEIKSKIKKWRNECASDHLSLLVPRQSFSKYDESKILTLPFPNNSLYIKHLPANVSSLKCEDRLAYIIAYQAIRIAGLLHDVGHMPYSHVLEHAINNLYTKVKTIPKEERTQNQETFLKELYNYCDPECEEKDELHEEIGKICASKIYECIANTSEPHEDNLFFVASYDFACSILRSYSSDNNIFSDLHQIVAGVVDADRLDYCNRDAYCTGLRKDLINYKRLFATYTVCQQEANTPLEGEEVGEGIPTRKKFFFCPDVKNVALIEDLLQRRWDIFSTVNFHHRVHKHEILLEEVIVEIGMEELQQEKRIDDLSKNVLPLRVYSIVQLIKLLKGNNPPEYLLIQFDDSWLDTLLKRMFLYRYNDDIMWSNKVANNASWNQYDELISVQRHYQSGFKRTEDFKTIDMMLFNRFKEDKLKGFIEMQLPQEVKDKLAKSFEKINDYNSFRTKYRSLFFTWLLSNTALKVTVLPEDKIEFFREVQDSLNEALKPLNKIQDVIIRDCSFKLGCASGKNILMVFDGGSAKPFQNYSIIEHILQAKRNDGLPMHLYYLPKLSEKVTSPYDFSIDKISDIYLHLSDAIWHNVIKRINEDKSETVEGGE